MLFFCAALRQEVPPRSRPGARIGEELFPRIGRGDAAAFEELYRLTEKTIYAYALSVLKHPSDAQDVMMETYLKIRESAHLYRPMGKPLAWMLTIARNLALMKLRAVSHVSERSYDDLSDESEFSGVMDREDGIVLRAALKLLLLPVVVAVAYEINRFVGRHDNVLTRALTWPGMMLQHFTTNEPDDSMIEVAIRSLELVIPEKEGSDKW